MTDKDKLLIAALACELECEFRAKLGHTVTTAEFLQQVTRNLECINRYLPEQRPVKE